MNITFEIFDENRSFEVNWVINCTNYMNSSPCLDDDSVVIILNKWFQQYEPPSHSVQMIGIDLDTNLPNYWKNIPIVSAHLTSNELKFLCGYFTELIFIRKCQTEQELRRKINR